MLIGVDQGQVYKWKKPTLNKQEGLQGQYGYKKEMGDGICEAVHKESATEEAISVAVSKNDT